VALAAHARSLVFNAVVACVTLAISLGSMAAHRGWDRDGANADDHHPIGAGGAVLAVAMTLPLVGRRLAPVPVLAVVAAATGSLYGLGYGFPPLALAIALYTAARWHDETRPQIRTAVLAGSAAALLVPSLVRHGLGPALFAGTIGWGVVWFAGDRVRQRSERIAEAAERRRQAEREAERERRLASAEERTRIARDLHDSAGHAVNVILVQAGAARLLLEQDTARSRAALRTIEDVARETLVEIDQLVRALRDPDGTDGVEPPAGMAALDTLVARSRAGGLDVVVEQTGERRALPPSVDQAAYRILREALTNASRHGTGTARVDLSYGSSALELVVTNPVRSGAGEEREGHGIVGMRERAALVDGTIEARTEGGSFRVRARLPYRDAS